MLVTLNYVGYFNFYFFYCVLIWMMPDIANQYLQCIQCGFYEYLIQPSKNELPRLCKNLARILHARLAWHVHAMCPFSCTILAQACTYLARNGARFCKSCCKNNYLHFLHIFARSCKNWCKIVQESCKIRDISRARAKQVLHARFLQDSCTILHDLASSFLLGRSMGKDQAQLMMESLKLGQ